jgi:hypothetical protein
MRRLVASFVSTFYRFAHSSWVGLVYLSSLWCFGFMKFALIFLPCVAFAQAPSSQPTSTPSTKPITIELTTFYTKQSPPKKPKDPKKALVLSIATSAVSYAGLGFGAQVFASGFTRGVAFGMLGLTGAVIAPSTGKIYLHKGGGKLFMTTALRFAASTTVIAGLVVAGDQLEGCSLSDCALIYGGTAALVGIGLYDIATTK